MKKYQILGEYVEQTAVWPRIIKKFAKRSDPKLDILMNVREENEFFELNQ